jgi:hypothetical protein
MKDLWDKGCYDGKSDPKDFENLFCRRCRNPDCVRAGWSQDQFSERVAGQSDLLLNPKMANPNDPRHRRVRGMDFPDLLREAVRLEASDVRGDWTLPADAVHLAPVPVELAPDKSEELVEKAVRSLRKETGPSEETDEAEVETLEASSPPNTIQRPTPVRADEQTAPRGFVPPARNTGDQMEGIMVGGGEPESEPEMSDPWAPKKKDQFVKPGATIKMGDSDE